jgi:DNA-3-methyladenine glycosylase II
MRIDPSPPHVVRFAAPLDLAESLEPFRRNGDDLLDRWDGRRLLRVSRVGARVVAWRAQASGDRDDPAVLVTTDVPLATTEAAALAAAVRRTFVAAPPEWPALLAADPVLAALDARHPGLRPFLVPDVLGGLVRGISAQQVNLAWAATTRRRLAEAVGDRHVVAGEVVHRLDAARLADTPVEAIRALQFTTAKAQAIVEVARAVASGGLDVEALAFAPDDAVIERLVALRGIGRWSAEWVLARTLGRPRVVGGDLGVRKAVGRAYLGVAIASEEEVRRATAHWGPSAAVAQTLLLRTLVP